MEQARNPYRYGHKNTVNMAETLLHGKLEMLNIARNLS